MFKQLINEYRINLSFSPCGPILIKSGIAVAAGTNMAFVKTRRNGREEVYLPGSSLKGVIRAQGERIGRTLNEKAVCNPFNTKLTDPDNNPSPFGLPGCSDAFESIKKNKKREIFSYEAYQGSCPICTLFGSLYLAGRFNISDAYIDEKAELPLLELRDCVGIDRFTGGVVNGANFDFEVITSGEFHTAITITNFELWQISLLCFILRDFEDELIPLGMGSSRGLGRIKANVKSIQIDLISTKTPTAIEGLGTLYQGKDREKYGFDTENPLPLPTGAHFERAGIRQRMTIGPDQRHDFYQSVQDYFPTFISNDRSMQKWREDQELKQ